jgi:hypothetical protein
MRSYPIACIAMILVYPGSRVCFAQSTKTIDCPADRVHRDTRQSGGGQEFCEHHHNMFLTVDAFRSRRGILVDLEANVIPRFSALVLAAITAWLWAATPGADSVTGEDAQTGSRAVNGGGSGPLLV